MIILAQRFSPLDCSAYPSPVKSSAVSKATQPKSCAPAGCSSALSIHLCTTTTTTPPKYSTVHSICSVFYLVRDDTKRQRMNSMTQGWALIKDWFITLWWHYLKRYFSYIISHYWFFKPMWLLIFQVFFPEDSLFRQKYCALFKREKC